MTLVDKARLGVFRILFRGRIKRLHTERAWLSHEISKARRLHRPVTPLVERQRAITHKLMGLGL